MLTSRYIRLFTMLLALSMVTVRAYAQREIHHIPPLINPDGYDPDLAQPFINPFAFDPDFQFFAPAEVDELNSEVEANTGWFATYDRANLYMTRPEAEDSRVQGDWAWGNRFDLGYMTDEEHGWLISVLHIDGPNHFTILEQERINVVDARDEINFPPGSVVLRGTAGQQQQQQAAPRPGFPIRDRNNPITNARDYLIKDSVNVADLSSVELNKTFRLKQLHYGSIIEPFFGVRYFNFNDYYQRDRYARFDGTTGALVYSSDIAFFPPPPPLAGISTEQFNSLRAQFENHMFGGQLGLRWYKQKSRWNLSGEVRAFAVHNFQAITVTNTTEHTAYSSGAANATVTGVFTQHDITSAHSSEFVFGTELRAEAAFELTKYVQIRGGMQFMDFARGVGRGVSIVRNDEDLLLVGVTFGVAVNR